jgi:hypothetical protein
MCGKAGDPDLGNREAYPVYPEVKVPEEYKDAYAMDRVLCNSPGGVEDGERIAPLSM